MDEFIVTYTIHRVTRESEEKTETMTRGQLIKLLNNGMVTVWSAKLKQ